MICVSVAESGVEACLDRLRGINFAEIRIDALEKAEAADMARIFNRSRRMIATCRPGPYPDPHRRELLRAALAAGAGWADVELESPEDFIRDIRETTRRFEARLLVSFHDFSGTPSAEELERIREACFDKGADAAKLSCLVETRREAARLLGLLDDPRPLVVVGMGREGRIVRAAAPRLGALFTYASPAPGKETAPGQLDRTSLQRILHELETL